MAEKTTKKTNKYKVGFKFFESYANPSNGISKNAWNDLKEGTPTELKGIDPDFLANLLHNKQIKEI
tara:strand:- start:587 stop:784 length:198 start_codon:yes stop_codon:yes gene_type:complete